MTYKLKPVSAPVASGGMLRMLCVLAENPVTGPLLAGPLLKSAGVVDVRNAAACEAPWTPLSLSPGTDVRDSGRARTDAATDAAPTESGAAPGAARGFQFRTCADFQAAYREGSTDPEAVAHKALDACRKGDELDPKMRIFIAQIADDVLAQARASSARWRKGQPLGPLDGVPVAVKDEVDMVPYPTTVGTRFLGNEPARTDACVVERLREAGAVLLGKANMHEFGMGVTGLNPHHGSARNPYDPRHCTGGSSSGSAAAVGAGLCPLAVGADGGGSIRTPASFCGVVGLKPTFGRVSERGAAPVCWSLAHLGPIGATVADVTLGYAALAGSDSHDAGSLQQPAPSLEEWKLPHAQGLRLGIYRPWFEDATAPVVEACRKAIGHLVQAGAEVVEVEIPELELIRGVHLITIVSEMAAAHMHYYAAHHADYGLDVRLNLALARKLTNTDYVHAQRLRTRLCGHFVRALNNVDAIVTPTTGMTAPLLPGKALSSGQSNLAETVQIMLYVQAANLTGFPAITVPAGYDPAGLPIGLQLMGRPWEEDRLLRLAAAVERNVERRKPLVFLKD
ncbi:MAG: amidase [Deltaproteobacteria bacterium]|nr:amidase [Deltaproteobacteria bacterium]